MLLDLPGVLLREIAVFIGKDKVAFLLCRTLYCAFHPPYPHRDSIAARYAQAPTSFRAIARKLMTPLLTTRPMLLPSFGRDEMQWPWWHACTTLASEDLTFLVETFLSRLRTCLASCCRLRRFVVSAGKKSRIRPSHLSLTSWSRADEEFQKGRLDACLEPEKRQTRGDLLLWETERKKSCWELVRTASVPVSVSSALCFLLIEQKCYAQWGEPPPLNHLKQLIDAIETLGACSSARWLHPCSFPYKLHASWTEKPHRVRLALGSDQQISRRCLEAYRREPQIIPCWPVVHEGSVDIDVRIWDLVRGAGASGERWLRIKAAYTNWVADKEHPFDAFHWPRIINLAGHNEMSLARWQSLLKWVPDSWSLIDATRVGWMTETGTQLELGKRYLFLWGETTSIWRAQRWSVLGSDDEFRTWVLPHIKN